MSALYERIVRPILFPAGATDPEVAHDRVLRVLARIGRSPAARHALRRIPRIGAPRTVFGIDFPNAVGRAAGVDRDALAVPVWAAPGFGFVEVGTVSLHAGVGHPRPRLQHLTDSATIVNRIGFATAGAAAMAQRLRALGRPPVPLGISLGRSDRTAPHRHGGLPRRAATAATHADW
jgi:dihydroorotate dehydrogenase